MLDDKGKAKLQDALTAYSAALFGGDNDTIASTAKNLDDIVTELYQDADDENAAVFDVISQATGTERTSHDANVWCTAARMLVGTL